MKKITRILAFLLIFTMLFPLVSCKKDKDGEKGDGGNDWNPYPYENLGDYLTLPDYKSFTISQAYIDNEINLILAALFDDQKLYVDVKTDRVSKAWDRVTLEFSNVTIGDETVFPLPEDPEGGEDTEEKPNTLEFTIGTHITVAELENAATGIKLNEEKELTFTFSADYKSNPDYAGKTATLKFKLTKLQEPPELTDDLCYRYTSYVNPEIMREAFEQEVIYAKFWDEMLEKSVLKARPEKEFNDYYNWFVDIFKTYAKSNNKTLEEYVTTDGKNHPSMGLYDGITMNEFYALANAYADDHLKNDLLLHSLIRAEGLQTSGGLYEAAQRQLLLSYGVGYTIDSLIEQHGKDQIITSIMDIQVRRRILTYVTKTAG